MERDGSSPDNDAHGASKESVPYASAYHAPVLCTEVIRHLVTDEAGVYVDGTLGGGGHAAALLEALGPAGRVVGIDRDADALEAARARLAAEVERERLTLVQGAFGNLERLLGHVGVSQIDGLLLDLGLSSHQIDQAERGFS